MQIRKDIVLEGSSSITANVLVDTGASMTLLPKSVADRIGVKYTGEQVSMSGAFAGMGDMADVAVVSIRFPFLNNLLYVTRVAVSTKANDILLGLDILNPLKMTIDTHTHEIVVKNEVIEVAKAGLMVAGGIAITALILKALFDGDQ